MAKKHVASRQPTIVDTLFGKSQGARGVAIVFASLIACASVFFLDWKLQDAILAPVACIPLLTIALINTRGALVSAVFAAIAFASLNRSNLNLWTDAFALATAYWVCILILTFAREQVRRKTVFETQIESAREVHDHLFPLHLPQTRAWNFELFHVPLHDVGGDFYSIRVRLDAVRVFVGDVTGKGLRASMLLPAVKVLIDLDDDAGPGKTLSDCNRSLNGVCTDEMFCTGWLGVFSDDGHIVFAAAGHEPSIICRVDGTCENIDGGGLPLGMLVDSAFEAKTMYLSPGDRLLLYSDGLSELFAITPTLVDEVFGDFSKAEQHVRVAARRDDVLALMITFRGDSCVSRKDTVDG
jgi:hypothetical protein